MDQHPLFGKSGIRSQSCSRPTVSLKTHIGNSWTHYTFIRVFFEGFYFHFEVSTPGLEMPESPAPPSPPPSLNPVSHVNQLSTAINPFPLQKLDLFIKLSVTFHPPPPESLLWFRRGCVACSGDPLHRSEHSGGDVYERGLLILI